mmetsp:Transcript_6304/g.15128  ORF Transcript_6304/g.15128 Transcript_6304/m.15128 type:complete len:916 (+) Transcript_6304:46-2793(+)
MAARHGGTAPTTAADTMGFRLILSDRQIKGGQLFRTYPNQRLISREQILGLLQENFGYDELLASKGLTSTGGGAEAAAILQIVGFDGGRRIPIRTNEDMRNFSVTVQSTKLPTVEVHLPSAAADRTLRSKPSKDRVEELEDLNKQLESSAERVHRRVDELERSRLGDREEMQRIVNIATRDLADLQKESVAPLTAGLAEMRELIDSSTKDYTTVMRTIDTHDKAHRVSLKEVNKNMEDFTTRIQFQLAEMGADISRLTDKQKTMGKEYDELRDWLNRHHDEIEKIVTTKVEVSRYEQQEAERNERFKKETTALAQAVRKVEKDAEGKYAGLKTDLGTTIQQHHTEHTERLDSTTASLTTQLASLAEELRTKVEDGDSQLRQLATSNHTEVMNKVNANHAAHSARIDEHHMEARTKIDKLDVSLKQKLAAVHKDLSKTVDSNHSAVTTRADRAERELANLITSSAAQTALGKQLATAQTEFGGRLDKVHSELHEKIEVATSQLEQHVGESVEALTNRLDVDVSKTKEESQAASAAILERLMSEMQKISDETTSRLDTVERTIVTKDMTINKKTDALTRKCETTFKDVHERMEEGMKAERTRLSNMEKLIQDTSSKVRHDFRSETERLRRDYEQDTARLDGDLSDLHMKHDVVKQEINFFQSRLLEQKDWAQRQFMEAATATRLAQVDSQEGLAASTKMLQALKDDVVGFREKMAKHISTLQNSSDSHGDAISQMEVHRTRGRSDLDALIYDHKAYVEDMDGWADDVRLKVERLFKAMEPSRAEWQIHRANIRGKELKKPLALKSPTFALQGLQQVQMEFFPNGHNHSPEGKCVLRLLFPAGAAVRFECYVGRMTAGTNEFDSKTHGGGTKLSMDFFFDSWYEEIRSDGSLPIAMEVLADLTSDESSLTRCVHLQSQ